MLDRRTIVLATLALALTAAAAPAQPSPYAGKTVTMVIGFGPGGGYDLWGRTVARHIGKHLPGKPTVVPQNMPGAGSYVAASHLYNTAAKDGTVIGIIARDAALGPLTGAPGARFDATKFSWLGTPTKEHNVCIARAEARVKTAQDLREHTLILGNTGPGTGTYTYPRVLADLLGFKFRNIGGFPASSDVFLAIERGEVEGICESLDSVKARRADWLSERKVSVLLQGGTAPHPELKGVPFVPDLARNDDERKILEFVYAGQGVGRPFVAPPGLPPERLQMLRDAFAATMKDPEFIADARRGRLELDPEDGAHLQALIERIYATPKPIVERVGKLIK
jgi:tripartite-type tricarboxylate transporter receptor subunit TctC